MAKDTVFSLKKSVRIKGKIYDFDSPQIMGILNVTPDSFFDGGKLQNEDQVLTRAAQLVSEGAQIIDVGGFSTRPGMEIIPADEEIKRVIPVIQSIHKNFPEVIISCDTFRTEVADACILAGAGIINDISGGRWDTSIYSLCAGSDVAYVMMHSRNSIEHLHGPCLYKNIAEEVFSELKNQAAIAEKNGLNNIIFDPGFGFSKNAGQNFELLNHLDKITEGNFPVLIGLSRKSMIWKTLDKDPHHALNGTTALNMFALTKGANILRVHDVKEANETIQLFNKLNYGKER